MKTELENAKWIVMGLRESPEKIREAQEEESEWDKIAEAEETWE